MSEQDRCILCGQEKYFKSGQQNTGRCVSHSSHHIWNKTSQGTVYVMCWPKVLGPRVIESADRWNRNPGNHYVGWTRQSPVTKRVIQHGWPENTLVHTEPGTPSDEDEYKRAKNCPLCGDKLAVECLEGAAPAYREKYGLPAP